MNELKIRLKLGEFEIELKGERETVKEEFKDLKQNGLGKIFESFPTVLTMDTKKGAPPAKPPKEASLKPPTTTSKVEKKSSSSKNRSATSKSYKLLTDLNLRPPGKDSLLDFYGSFIVKSNMERNVVILYYLKRILELQDVGLNHMYTCYKKVGAKIPNIYQSLLDTKNRKGWVDTTNTEDLKVSIQGENYIEHDAPKSSPEQ